MELLKDTDFQNGFVVGHIDSLAYTGNMLEWKFNTMTPSWKICQWCSKYPLFENCEIRKDGDNRTISNAQKSVTRLEDGSVKLLLKTDLEYDHPREGHEGWPHLLLEQFFIDNRLTSLKELTMDVDFEFTYFKDHMKETRTNLHTFQVSWYLAIANRNQESKGYGDFLWFGLPFIDYPRYDFPQPFRAVDGGKEDATQKYIVAVDPHLYLEEKTHVGSHYQVEVPVLALIKEAFEYAKGQGYLKNTEFEDLGLLSTNFGIEDTGTFDGELWIHHIHLRGDYNEK